MEGEFTTPGGDGVEVGMILLAETTLFFDVAMNEKKAVHKTRDLSEASVPPLLGTPSISKAYFVNAVEERVEDWVMETFLRYCIDEVVVPPLGRLSVQGLRKFVRHPFGYDLAPWHETQ